MPVYVRGLRELNRAFAKADKDARKELRASWRGIAAPIRRGAETLAQRDISRIGSKWYKMRTGVTRRAVYVAPLERSVRPRGANPRRRPNLANLLMGKAMEPALEHHESEVEHEIEQVFDRVADNFNRGGPV